MSLEKDRLVSLVEFVQQSVRLRAKPPMTVAQHSQFGAHEHSFRTLPGVHFNQGDADALDEVWLSVERLHERKPPDVNSTLFPWVQLSPSPTEEPTLREISDGKSLISAGTHQSIRPPRRGEKTNPLPTIDPEAIISLSGSANEAQVRADFDTYLSTKWKVWATEEVLRRRTIRLYSQLFTLKQQLEGGIVEAQLELVWGVGIGVWKCDGATISYPLITRQVELVLNLANARIEVRPRDVEPRLEIDWYSSVNNPGVADLEKIAKEFFRSNAKTFSPFDRGTFEPLLTSAVSHLDANGVYWPNEAGAEDRRIPSAEDNLRVTDTWVLFARPRTQSVFIQDLDRLRAAIGEVEDPSRLPAAVAAIVTKPSEVNSVVEMPAFRGVCASYQGGSTTEPIGRKIRDLYFPKVFNNEQVRIVQLLEVSDGVVVQGPPGTGKTHTIANVISHYLAEGKRVLVTSMKDPALAVLQEQLPDEIRPLAISLLSSEQAGMKQFEHAIQKIAAEVQVIDRPATARAIGHLEESIDRMHGQLAAIDRRVNGWAIKNLAKFWLDGDELSPLDATHEVIEGIGQFEWLPDALGIADRFAPPVSDADMASLRAARRNLGGDIEYLGLSLPQVVQFPETSELLQVHRDLSQFEKLRISLESGDIPALSPLVNASFDRVHRLAAETLVLLDNMEEIRRAGRAWAPLLRTRLLGDADSLFSVLEALGVELVEGATARLEFVKRPVIMPEGAESNGDVCSAVENLSDGRSAFGFSGIFGKGPQKTALASIRIVGIAPSTPEHWKHISEYLALQRKLKALGIRWNALAGELGLPLVSVDRTESVLDAVREYEIYSKLRDSVELARRIRSAAVECFPGWQPAFQLVDDEQALRAVLLALQHHIARQRLANVWQTKERFAKVLDGRRGRIVGDLRDFLANSLGNPVVSDAEMQTRWSALMAELSRVLGLEGDLEVVRSNTAKLEMSGAERYAATLREPMLGAVDVLIPDNWRKAWRLRRLSTYIESIDPKEELKKLAHARREAETHLAHAYSEVVVKRTWLKLAENASPVIRAALQSYLAAIQRIGKGTGKRAARFRQDARNAASQANPAVPCWIMPHYRVSESLPPELGCFDLVIIDEASQSDLTALPALLRAKKVLVVGDDKQVSPEGVGLEEEKVRNLMVRLLSNQVDTYRPQMDPSRSIYDLFKVVFATSAVMLREHFRCVAPIIEFSKREFYDHELRPLRLPKSSERLDPPLIDVFVEDGYRKGDTNLAEARFIVEEIKKIVGDPATASRSIGVVSLLGDKQALAIWERLTDELGPEIIQRHRIECGDARTFQGKERDIMFLTMVAAPNDMGAPLVGARFDQRFNVAASRARDRMYLVRSVANDHLSTSNTLRRSLIAHFAAPFALDEVHVEDLRKLCESPFECEVYDLLIDRGYRVTPQVKVGQYRIDMVVEGNNDTRLAVECDGDKYHGADKWADDMERQGTLERAGWKFWRSFASTFFKRREEVVADLLKTLSEHGVEPVSIEHGPRSIHSEHRTVSATAPLSNGETMEGDISLGTDLNGFEQTAPSTATDDSAAEEIQPVPAVEPPLARERSGHAPHVVRTSGTPDPEMLLDYCRDQKLAVVDNRAKGGALWVSLTTQHGAIAEKLRLLGLRYAKNKGWWLK